MTKMVPSRVGGALFYEFGITPPPRAEALGYNHRSGNTAFPFRVEKCVITVRLSMEGGYPRVRMVMVLEGPRLLADGRLSAKSSGRAEVWRSSLSPLQLERVAKGLDGGGQERGEGVPDWAWNAAEVVWDQVQGELAKPVASALTRPF